MEPIEKKYRKFILAQMLISDWFETHDEMTIFDLRRIQNYVDFHFEDLDLKKLKEREKK